MKINSVNNFVINKNYTKKNTDITSSSRNNLIFGAKKISTSIMKNTDSINYFKRITMGSLTLASLMAFKKQRLLTINEKLENYKNIFKPIQLEENIKFKKAKTLEEGILYSKNILKIKEVDKNISLDALNYVNKSITDLSNANNGKITVPNRISYGSEFLGGKKNKNSTITGYIVIDSKDEDIGTLFIEKKNFDNKFLDKCMETDCFLEDGSPAFKIKNGKVIEACYTLNGTIIVPDRKLALLMEKYYKNPNKLSLEEKRIIHFGLNSNGKTDGDFYIVSADGYYEDMYHELGHLQDMSKNYKTFLSNGKDSDYRWITIDHLDSSFIERISDLRDFYSEKEQNIVGKISDYSKTSIGEFIAETYAQLILNRPISPEVMALYEKYNGPMLNK